jgi:hypothetical protein
MLSQGVRMNAQEAGHNILLSRLVSTLQFVIMIYWPPDAVYEQLDNLFNRMWQTGFSCG